ncbi:MAG: acyltransferase family protein [Ktedonobacterales bacterium]
MAPSNRSIRQTDPSAAGTAPPGQAAAAPRAKRLLFLDNVRIVLICGVLVAHLDDTYGALGSWDYRDPANNVLTGTILSIPTVILMACGLGCFFLLAGYFTPGSYDRKGASSFVRDRVVRLGLPLLLYELLIQPLAIYIAGGLHGAYWSFYGTYLLQVRGVYGVVWFLVVLLLFDLLYAGWRVLTRPRRAASPSLGPLPSSPAIAGFIVALALVTFVVRIWWPMNWVFQPVDGLEVSYLPQYLSLFILGVVAYRRNWLEAVTPRMARKWSLIALLATLLIFCGLELPAGLHAAETQTAFQGWGGFNWLAFGYALWEAFLVVGVCLGLLVLFRQRWNHQGRLAAGLAASVFTVYLIHPVVLIGFAYAFHWVALYPLLKWGIAVLITIPLCFLISGWIRKIPFANRVL